MRRRDSHPLTIEMCLDEPLGTMLRATNGHQGQGESHLEVDVSLLTMHSLHPPRDTSYRVPGRRRHFVTVCANLQELACCRAPSVSPQRL
jgi:hypothetical protein